MKILRLIHSRLFQTVVRQKPVITTIYSSSRSFISSRITVQQKNVSHFPLWYYLMVPMIVSTGAIEYEHTYANCQEHNHLDTPLSIQEARNLFYTKKKAIVREYLRNTSPNSSAFLPAIQLSVMEQESTKSNVIKVSFKCKENANRDVVLCSLLQQLQHQSSDSNGKQASYEHLAAVLPLPVYKSEHERPFLSYVFANGSGSFYFVPPSNESEKYYTLEFYKDRYLTRREINAIMSAFEVMLDTPIKNSPTRAIENDTEIAKAIKELEGLGISVFQPESIIENQLNWDSLAGSDLVKRDIMDTIVLPLQQPELYENIAKKTRARYESNRPRAVLFEGPPGTGKTLSARIIAQQAGLPLIHLPVENIVSKWYGESEKQLAKVFTTCEKMNGAVIFIDEIDSLVGNRGNGVMHEASRRILSVLLQKVEGFDSAKKTTIICATNRKQDLDSALVSRFDLSICYDLPSQETRSLIFGRYAQHLTRDDLNQLAQLSSGCSGRDIKEICEYTERKWASKILKKEETGELPGINEYMKSTKNHYNKYKDEMSRKFDNDEKIFTA